MNIMYMKRALEVAMGGAGYTNPNPLVGAVVVKNDRIIGEGFHERYGGLHAERNALAACTEAPGGGDLYVTLEPCCHYGKTPPCTEAIIEAKISRVFVGSADPNPLVAGKGIQALREAGIEVKTDVMREECDHINPFFFHYIATQKPYVALKYAMTLDGKIAARTGISQWITGEEARGHVQQLRHRYAGIMTGIGTVLADDPRLTCRLAGGVNPVRIICDSRLRIPLASKLCQTAKEVPTFVATCSEWNLGDSSAASQGKLAEGKIHQLEELGVTVLVLPAVDGHLDLSVLMEELGRRKLDSILVEGGSELSAGLLSAGLVQKVYAYVAPKLLGGREAKSPIGGLGAASPDECVPLGLEKITQFGQDLLLEYEVK